MQAEAIASPQLSERLGTDQARAACIVMHSYMSADPRARRYAEALLADGWSLDIICLREPASSAIPKWADRATVYQVPVQRHRGSGIARYLLEYVTFFVLAGAVITATGLRRRYQLVQVHNLPDFLVFCAAAPRLLGARVLLDIRDPMPDLYVSKFCGNWAHPMVRLLSWVEGLSTRFADHVLTPGEPSRKRLIGRNIPPRKVTNVLNSADPTLFAPIERPAQFKTSEDLFTLVYHGGLFYRYGLDIAILAVSRLKDEIPALHLRIAGVGEEAPHLQRLVKELGLCSRVHIAGWIPPEDIRGFVADADLGLVPYRQDTFTDLIYPTKAFEYIALGVPVIISRLEGIVELLGDVPNLFFAADSVEDLADRIRCLYEDRDRLSRLLRETQRAYAPYGWEMQKQAYLTLIGQLLETKQCA